MKSPKEKRNDPVTKEMTLFQILGGDQLTAVSYSGQLQAVSNNCDMKGPKIPSITQNTRYYANYDQFSIIKKQKSLHQDEGPCTNPMSVLYHQNHRSGPSERKQCQRIT